MADSRERIIDTALGLIAEHGYEGMSLQMVADRVGLHKSTLFHYFKSKEQLAHEVYSGIGERLLKRIEPLLAVGKPSLDQVLRLSDELVDHFSEERGAARFLMRLMVAEHESALSARVFAFDADDAHPFDQVLVAAGAWLDRARRAGVIRRIKVRHTLINLLGLVLFYPAIAHATGSAALDADPWSETSLGTRKRELRNFLRAALEAH